MNPVIATGPAADLGWALNNLCRSGKWYSVHVADGVYEIAEREGSAA